MKKDIGIYALSLQQEIYKCCNYFFCKNESLLLLVNNERNFSLENIVSIIPLKRNVLDVGLIFNGDQIQFI